MPTMVAGIIDGPALVKCHGIVVYHVTKIQRILLVFVVGIAAILVKRYL